MKGTLTGCVLSTEHKDGALLLTLAGITANDKAGVTWIHHVRFTGSRIPAQLPQPGQVIGVDCMAAQEHFTGRGGVKASRVIIHGVRLFPTYGRTIRKGQVTFLEQATNQFVFSGHVVKLLTKPVGVTEVRLCVTDRRGQAHYFNAEGWRGVSQQLASRKAGAELEVSAILRRDRDDSKGFQRAFDVMELQAVRDARSTPRTTTHANAAD